MAQATVRNSADSRPEVSLQYEGWREALAARSFWLLVLGVCCISLSENGALAHLAPMLNDRGVKPADAALIVSILGASSLGGRLLLGWLLDYLEGSYIAVFSMLAAGGGVFLLAHAQSFHAAAPGALIAGLGMGCELDLIPYMLRRYFGMRSFSTLYGLVYSGFAVSGAVAPLLLGYLYDRTESYTGILSIFSSITAIAAFGMLLLPAYRLSVHTSTTSIGQEDGPSFEAPISFHLRNRSILLKAIEQPPIYLPDVEANPQPGPYADLIQVAKDSGREHGQIWHLFA
jgi:MFS family permease